MNTSVKDLAALMATAIWADGEFDEAEKIVLDTIAEAFEIEEESLQKEVDASLAEVQSMNEDEVNDYLLSHSAEIEDEEAEMIFEALLEIVLCDGELSSEEVDNLMAMASAMGIDDSRAILMLVDMVKEEEDCVVRFN
jgi:uncharacterized tellurite resistance protein B-like protein